MALAHRMHLPFIAQTPGFPLGGVFRPGPDRARSRGSMVMVFTLFRGSISTFLLVGRATGLPDARDPINSIRFWLPGSTVAEAGASSKGTTIILTSDILR